LWIAHGFESPSEQSQTQLGDFGRDAHHRNVGFATLSATMSLQELPSKAVAVLAPSLHWMVQQGQLCLAPHIQLVCDPALSECEDHRWRNQSAADAWATPLHSGLGAWLDATQDVTGQWNAGLGTPALGWEWIPDVEVIQVRGHRPLYRIIGS